jgi:hypothetical protein
MARLDFNLLTCPQWDARPPKGEPPWTGKPSTRFIIHHTAGHAPELDSPANESVAEAIAYARSIQSYHMSQGWLDSGHNFLVCRNGWVLQGRWRTVRAIQAKQMVVSAHCPGQNTQVGIEHEHQGLEPMTTRQLEASCRLMAWVCRCYGLKTTLGLHPHREYYATSCPANLTEDIPRMAERVNELLAGGA